MPVAVGIFFAFFIFMAALFTALTISLAITFWPVVLGLVVAWMILRRGGARPRARQPDVSSVPPSELVVDTEIVGDYEYEQYARARDRR